MRIEKNTIYHLPTHELQADFAKQAEKEGYLMYMGEKPTDYYPRFESLKEESCVRVLPENKKRLSTGGKTYYERSSDFSHLPMIEWKITKPRIIKVGKAKFIFNPPYTIVTDGTHTGKAKCNPAEEYDPITGLEIAKKRFEEAKFPDKSGELLKEVKKLVKPEFRVGDEVEITGGWYHNFKIGDIGVVVKLRGVIDSACEVKVGDLEQSIKVEDCKLIEKLKVGDRVEMINARGYSFDKVGNTGTVVFVSAGNLVQITVDGYFNPHGENGWNYLNASEQWKKLCTR